MRPRIRISIVAVVALLAGSSRASALTTFFVDPDYAGSVRDGSAARPWQSLSDTASTFPWNAINAALATDTVTVYFSARNASSDTDQLSTVQLALDRTAATANRLTLDGMSKYNSNDAAPVWLDYTGTSRFRITRAYPLTSDNFASPFPTRSFVTVRGFRLVATNGQIASLAGVTDFIFELNDGTTLAGATTGPGVILGRASNGTTYSARVIIRNNNIHETYGEGLYIGGSTADPPGGGSVVTNNDVLIQGNTITDPGLRGGQGDGIDVKDGNTNLRIIGNKITHPTFNANCDCQGIIAESADLIDSNFISSPQHIGIATGAAWNNAFGRNQLVIRNNMVVNMTGTGSTYGIKLYGGTTSTYEWANTQVYNNTIYNATNTGISGDPLHVNVTIVNNILSSVAGGISMAPGTLAVHNNNDYFNAGTPLFDGVSSFSCSTLALSEPLSICADPRFVSTTAPYVDTNFRLALGSPALNTGATITSFSTDYFGCVRATPWEIGAVSDTACTPSSVAPPPAPVNIRILR
jgi:hypothetical protein